MQVLRVIVPIVVSQLLLASVALPASAQDGRDSVVAAERVRPGDRIALRFLREPALSDSVTVSERGEAPFPKIGILRVNEMSIAQLQDTLRARYAEFLRLPELEITVLRRVVVNGEVHTPGVYMVDMTTGVRDVIALAGGITDNGNRGKVTVVRGSRQIRVPHWDRGDASAFPLLSGDQVLVPRRNWWAINALPAVSTAVLVASLLITVTR